MPARRALPLLLALGLLAGCATGPGSVSKDVREQLAPTGKLRAGINTGNVLFTTRDAASGRLSGVSLDVMNELGRRLGIPVEMVVYATPGQVADAAGRNAWDAAILAIEPARAKTVTFSPAITQIEASYLVKADSPHRNAADMDKPGVRIAVTEKAGYELYLSRTIKNATLVRGKAHPETFALFTAGKADAFANLKPVLMSDWSRRAPGLRILEGRFMTVEHGIATPAGRPAADAYLKAFVEDLNRSGFIARSIERHRVEGLLPIR